MFYIEIIIKLMIKLVLPSLLIAISICQNPQVTITATQQNINVKSFVTFPLSPGGITYLFVRRVTNISQTQ